MKPVGRVVGSANELRQQKFWGCMKSVPLTVFSAKFTSVATASMYLNKGQSFTQHQAAGNACHLHNRLCATSRPHNQQGQPLHDDIAYRNLFENENSLTLAHRELGSTVPAQRPTVSRERHVMQLQASPTATMGSSGVNMKKLRGETSVM